MSLKERREVGTDVHRVAESGILLPSDRGAGVDAEAQRHDTEIEDARGHRRVIRAAIDGDAILAELDADGRISDLHRLRFAAQRTFTRWRLALQERQRPIELDLVPDVEQPIDHGAARNPESGRGRCAISHPWTCCLRGERHSDTPRLACLRKDARARYGARLPRRRT